MSKPEAHAQTLAQRLKSESANVHGFSNSLVNARLIALLSDRHLYGRALACFYFIFEELERCLEHAADDPTLAALLPAARPLYRTAAIKHDLAYYLGRDWDRHTEVQAEVADYCRALRQLAATRPALLAAHSFTQHMALASGGQVVSRWARRAMALPPGLGTASFEYGGGATARQLKDVYIEVFNGLEPSLTADDVAQLVGEHLEAFRHNNRIMRAFSVGWLAPLLGLPRAAALFLPPRTVWAWALLATLALLALVALRWLLNRRWL